MNRFVIMTVGKTHSGKTTFAKELEKKLVHSVMVDQDAHAEFLQTHYARLLPKEGPNLIKYALTRTIVDYAVNETDCYIILSNSNLSIKNRTQLLAEFHNKGFTSILVHFDIADSILQERTAASRRSTEILRTAVSFQEVLDKQQTNGVAPSESEADILISIKQPDETPAAINQIVGLVMHEEEK